MVGSLVAWMVVEEQNALSSWKEVMIQISPFHDSSSLGCSQRLPCFWWWSPPFNSSRFSRIRLPPPSLYVCTMISTWSKKTRASIHGKSCCNLLQRLMGVDCARGLWLVAALNESHDSRVRKEQHIKSLFLRQCKWPCDLNFHEFFTDFSQNLNIQFFLSWEEHSFYITSKTGNKMAKIQFEMSLNGFWAELFMRLDDDGHPNILVV